METLKVSPTDGGDEDDAEAHQPLTESRSVGTDPPLTVPPAESLMDSAVFFFIRFTLYTTDMDHEPNDFEDREVDGDFFFAEEIATEDLERTDATADDLPL